MIKTFNRFRTKYGMTKAGSRDQVTGRRGRKYGTILPSFLRKQESRDMKKLIYFMPYQHAYKLYMHHFAIIL